MVDFASAICKQAVTSFASSHTLVNATIHEVSALVSHVGQYPNRLLRQLDAQSDRRDVTDRERPAACRQAGARIGLIFERRQRLKIQTIGAAEMNTAQRAACRGAPSREGHIAARRMKEARSKAEYLAESTSRNRPWEAEGINRRTGIGGAAGNLAQVRTRYKPMLALRVRRD